MEGIITRIQNCPFFCVVEVREPSCHDGKLVIDGETYGGERVNYYCRTATSGSHISRRSVELDLINYSTVTCVSSCAYRDIREVID